jgi:surface carbohydrate biosynthesis protein
MKRDVVILDETGSWNLVPFLGKDVSFFIIKHESEIYIKYLLKSIFTGGPIGLSSIVLNYYIEMIKRVNPKLVITNIDNVPFYWKLDAAISDQVKFLTVQNGTHLLGVSDDIPECYKRRFLDYPPYYSNLACLSEFDFDHYSKFGATINNYSTIGSILISSYISNYEKMGKLYDICIVSNNNNNRPGEKNMLDYTLNYIKTHNVKVCIALKESYCSAGFKENLVEFGDYLKHKGVVLVGKVGDGSHYLSDVSEVTIAHGTTFLRQTFSRGNKIYPMNFIDPLMSPPYDLLGYSLSPTYSEFELHLNDLLSIDSKKYQKKYQKVMKYLDVSDKNNPPHERFEKLVRHLLTE